MTGKQNRGMTMVEVVVAFVMLALVMGILYSCIRFASNLMREAADIDRGNESFQSVIAETFKDSASYEQGKSTTPMTYVFKQVAADGTVTGSGTYRLDLYTVNVSFEKSDIGYVKLDSPTATGNVRNLYLFSTGGAGSSGGSVTTVTHTLTYLAKTEPDGEYIAQATVPFVEGTGVMELYAAAQLDNYTFDGWYTSEALLDVTKVDNINSLTRTATEDITLYGRYIPKVSRAKYTVKHMQQVPKLEPLEYRMAKTNDYESEVGTEVSAESLIEAPAGFVPAEDGNTLTGTVMADNSLELLIYYTREVYTIRFHFIYPDGTSAGDLEEKYTVGGYDKDGEAATLSVSYSDSVMPVKQWYRSYSDGIYSEPYSEEELETATGDLELYAEVAAPSSAVGIDNMETAGTTGKLSEKLPVLTEKLPSLDTYNSACPYINDGGGSSGRYGAIRDLMNEALASFGYSTTSNIYLTAVNKNNKYRLYLLDTQAIGMNFSADSTLDQIYHEFADYSGNLNTHSVSEGYSRYYYMELPQTAVAVYEHDTWGDHSWVKFDKDSEPTVYLVCKFYRYSSDASPASHSEVYLTENVPW